ncbi:MAG: 4-(cytidine 5'-diphospho)-2-C-methyl-D-erythritol kinase [Candidatus Kryptoniota bacterium]
MKILAPAKINIGLRIIQERPDGYHDIETIFYPIHLADELELSIAEKHEFYSNVDLDQETNLCLRALNLFCERTGINAEVKIKLNKKIPIGSGLGGASTDAAAVLTGLQELYNHPLSKIELFDIASLLGADVPFFLYGKPAYATRKGDLIEPINFHISLPILVVTPNISVSTAYAYSLVKPNDTWRETLKQIITKFSGDYRTFSNAILNDFESVIFQEFPLLKKLKEALYENGALFALMSGSGSSIYGIFEDENSALRTVERIKADFEISALDITLP